MRNNLTLKRAEIIRAIATVTAVCALVSLAGCGGGGGTTTTAPVTGTILGALQNASGAPLGGYAILFDNSTSNETTSNAQGQFTLVIPVSAITGSDTLVIKDSSGNVITIQSVSIPTTVSSTTSIGTLTLGAPPGPPSLSSVRTHG